MQMYYYLRVTGLLLNTSEILKETWDINIGLLYGLTKAKVTFIDTNPKNTKIYEM